MEISRKRVTTYYLELTEADHANLKKLINLAREQAKLLPENGLAAAVALMAERLDNMDGASGW